MAAAKQPLEKAAEKLEKAAAEISGLDLSDEKATVVTLVTTIANSLAQISAALTQAQAELAE